MSIFKGVSAFTHTEFFFKFLEIKSLYCKAQFIETSKVWADLKGLQNWNNAVKEYILRDPEKTEELKMEIKFSSTV